MLIDKLNYRKAQRSVHDRIVNTHTRDEQCYCGAGLCVRDYKEATENRWRAPRATRVFSRAQLYLNRQPEWTTIH